MSSRDGELRRALAAGIPPQRIIFSGVGKTRDRAGGGARRRHPPDQCRVDPGIASTERGRGGAQADRAGRDPGQSRCRRADPRQDLDRQEGEQVRHRHRRRRRGLSAWPPSCPASSRSALAVHIGSQLRRSRRRSARAFERVAELVLELRGGGLAGAPARSRRRPRHPLPRRDPAGAGGLCGAGARDIRPARPRSGVRAGPGAVRPGRTAGRSAWSTSRTERPSGSSSSTRR